MKKIIGPLLLFVGLMMLSFGAGKRYGLFLAENRWSVWCEGGTLHMQYKEDGFADDPQM